MRFIAASASSVVLSRPTVLFTSKLFTAAIASTNWKTCSRS
jgi:hypothetical protein